MLVAATQAAPAASVAPTEANPAPAAPNGENTAAQAPAKPAWMAQLPKDLLDDADLSQFDKLDKLARTYKDTRGKLSEAEKRLSETTAVPGKDATPEQIDAFWKTMGKPDAPDGYQFDRSGELEKVPQLPGLDEWTKELYHKLNLPKDVAESLQKENGKKSLELMNAIREKREADAAQGLKDLEKLWGREAPQKKAELEQVAKKFFGDEEWKQFADSPLANSAKFLDRLAGLKRYMSDSPIHTGSGAAGATEPKTHMDALKQALSK